MSDENNESFTPSSDVLAALQQDFGSVDRSMPLLKEDVYTLRVKEIKLEPSKNSPGKTNLKIQLVTTEDALDTDGKPLRAGWSVTHTISMDKTDKYDPARNLANFKDSMEGANSRGPLFPLEQFKDRLLKAKIIVEGERKDEKTGQTYPPSNRVKQFLPATA
jgi:hypothetical protein